MRQKIEYQLANNTIATVTIDGDGRMWLKMDSPMGSIDTQINYCPFTATPAPIQMLAEADRIKRYADRTVQTTVTL